MSSTVRTKTSTRRKFIGTAGAVLSAPVAAASATVATRAPSVLQEASDVDALKARLALLEDENAIRSLNHAFANAVKRDGPHAIACLYDNPANAPIDPSLRGITPIDSLDAIEVTEDGRLAIAIVDYLVYTERVIGPDCPLVEMARQQGGGFVGSSAHAIFKHEYVKRDGVWKFQRSTYTYFG